MVKDEKIYQNFINSNINIGDKTLAKGVIFEELFRNFTEAIVLVDGENNIVDINKSFVDFFGCEIKDIKGKNLDDIVIEKDNNKKIDNAKFLNGEKVEILETIRYGLNDKAKEVSIVFVPIIITNDIIGKYIIYTDISQRKKAERDILYMSYHDILTGLYNRRFFEEEIKRLDTKRNYPLAIVMADINKLKIVNDVFGHKKGDALLKKAAEIIKNECRSDDIIARIGGDEFAVMLPNTTIEDATMLIDRIKKICSKTHIKAIEISVAFGVCIKENEKQDINEIMKKAEDNMYRQKTNKNQNMQNETIRLMIKSAHSKNENERVHASRVSKLCEKLAKAMKLNKKDIGEVKLAGLLHDCGKISIDEDILNKTDNMNNEELELLRSHPEIGYRMLNSSNELYKIAEVVLSHHEFWNGKGYPNNIAGEDIPVFSRIISIVEAYDAMINGTVYRKPFTKEKTIKELLTQSGKQFDPEITSVFIDKVIDKIKQ